MNSGSPYFEGPGPVPSMPVGFERRVGYLLHQSEEIVTETLSSDPMRQRLVKHAEDELRRVRRQWAIALNTCDDGLLSQIEAQADELVGLFPELKDLESF